MASRGTFQEKAYWIFQLYKDNDISGSAKTKRFNKSDAQLNDFIEFAKTQNPRVIDILNSDMTL